MMGALLAALLVPNILVVLADDQDAGMVSVMPAVQAWAAQGVTFSNAYTTSPLCAPSRATWITGQWPHNHGVKVNAKAYAAMGYGDTLPVWLQAAGYSTAWFGKFLNGYGSMNAPGQSGQPCHEVPPGWTAWAAFVATPHYNDYILNSNGTVTKYGSVAAPPGCQVDAVQANVYSTDKLAQRAATFINSHTGVPWLLVVAPYASHNEGSAAPVPAARHAGLFAGDPFPIPGSLNYNEADVSDKPALVRSWPLLTPTNTATRAKYHRKRRESILAVDELVANLETWIVASGQDSRTVRIFGSDNGWVNGEHRIPGWKTYVYDESTRVPLIVKGPGYAAAVRSELVSHADLAPTIVALAGANAGRTMDGADLGPLLRGEAVAWRSALLVESRQTSAYDAVVTAGHVYVEHLTGEAELYERASDPGQLESKHDDPAFASVRAALSAQLASLRNCSGAGCWVQ